jgi:hypothetical protein
MKPEDNIEIAAETPKLNALKQELQESLTYAAQYVEQNRENDDTRFCVWDGQSEDGKKHEDDIGEEPFPWEGASDTRVRTADSIINERVMVQMAAFNSSKMQAVATEVNDMVKSQKATTLIKWMLFTQMASELRRETELLLQYKETYGAAIQGVFWQREQRLKLRKLNVEALQQLAQETQDPQLSAVLAAIFDPTQEEGLIDLLQQSVPTLTVAEARTIIDELRTKGETEFPVPYIFRNKPQWCAMRVFVEVFFPVQTRDIQPTRFVGCREWLSETQLQDLVESEGWNQEFVTECLKHKGKSSLGDLDQLVLIEKRRGHTRTVEDYADLVEVFRMFYKATRRGVPVTYCTVMHNLVKDKYGKHEAYEYDHAMYPFIEHVREWTSPSILDSRGVPEIVATWQGEIKSQRDFRADRASVAIMPPVKVPANRGKMKLIFGPASQIPERRSGEIEWMRGPSFDPGSNEVELAARRDCDEYFGLLRRDSHPTLVQLHQQHMVSNALTDFTLACQQTFQLMQQYLTDEEVSRIVGSATQFHASLEDIQGQFDIFISFDVRELDMEFLKAKLDFISKVVVPMDTAGVIDRADLVEAVFSSIDPNLAERVVHNKGSVTQQEVEDEQTQFAKIFAGIEPAIKESGQNFQLRLQTLQNILQTNPYARGRLNGSDPIFQQLVENRMKHFEFMLEQQQNAQIGRVGVKPVMQGQM